MKADSRFIDLPKSFWAYVRIIGQECGYSVRGAGKILVSSLEKVESKMENINISIKSFNDKLPSGMPVWDKLEEYFEYRAEILHNHVEPSLMDADSAKKEYITLKKKINPQSPQPMNKQKGDKRAPAILHLHDQYVD